MDSPTLSTRARRAVALGLAAVLVVYVLQAQFELLGAGADSVFGDWVYNALYLVAGGLCLARARRGGPERLAWALFGAGLLVTAAGELYWTAELSELAEPPYPSLADGLWLISYPLEYAALGLLVRSRLRGDFQRSLWLDGALGALAAASCAALVLPHVIDTTGGDTATVATNLAYPLLDLLLLSVAAGMLALTGWRPGRIWALLGAALAVRAVADYLYLYQASAGTYVENTVLDPLWTLSALMLAAAAWQPSQARMPTQLRGWRIFAFPSAFMVVAVAILVYDHFAPAPTIAVLLAGATLVVAVGRMALLFAENVRMLGDMREAATTDALTGLGNRRMLLDDLGAACESAAVDEPLMLALFDLDGFKGYNDSFGHPAGDALLQRLARHLEAAVAPHGRAYRMGGDEFCVLIDGGGRRPETVVGAASVALSDEGEGFAVSSSHGTVLIPDEASTPSEALQTADRRMYEQKEFDARSASRQACDALLSALRECEPDLRGHLADVSQLSVGVGRRLGLGAEATDEIRRAAELHDVGKMAVPEAIVGKPGPLSETEWAFMRRHTLIGERILGAAPALAPVGRLVRASHERYDGRGYPDGLAGDDIPLGARVIAVCDAFDAMISDRPYRRGIEPDIAIAELRRCAGAQFDPEVVDAFCAEFAELQVEAELERPEPRLRLA